EVDLGDLVEEVVDRLRTDAERAGCAMTVRAERPCGRWDRLRLEQIVVNLLANAFKYGAGRPIEVAVSREGADAELRVRDHGMGIAPKDSSRIFERFERAVSSANYGGLGLGLYV